MGIILWGRYRDERGTRAVFKEDGPIGWDAKGAKPVVLTECCGLLSRKGSPFSRKAVGFLGTSEEGEDALVHPTERRLRGNVAAASEGLGQGEVGEDLPRPREDGPGGEERILLGGVHRHRPPEICELFLAGPPGEPGV